MTPLGIAATVGILLPVAAVLVVLIVWWVKNVGRHRIPRPFLGEGPNVEWAEMRRAELTEAKQGHGPAESHSKNSLADGMDGPESKNTLHVHGSKESGKDALGSLPQDMAKGDEELLKAWLGETGHLDDAWAEKLLGRRAMDDETEAMK